MTAREPFGLPACAAGGAHAVRAAHMPTGLHACTMSCMRVKPRRWLYELVVPKLYNILLTTSIMTAIMRECLLEQLQYNVLSAINR
jgi:hypothetical protein